MATLISEYSRKPSPDSQEAGCWKVSLMEKLWVVLMAVALTVAAINAAAEGSGANEGTVSAPSANVIVDVSVN